MGERYFSSLRRALLFKFVSKHTVNSMTCKVLSAEGSRISGRRCMESNSQRDQHRV